VADLTQPTRVAFWKTAVKAKVPTTQRTATAAAKPVAPWPPAPADQASRDAGHVPMALAPASRASTDPMLQRQLAGLVQRTFLAPDQRGPAARSIVFAGVDESLGSAWLAAATAEILAAQVSGEVCLVDADLDRPSLHRVFGLSNVIGLAEGLNGHEPLRSYARRLHAGTGNAPWLMTAGSPGGGSESLLVAGRDRRRIRDLIESYDFVVMHVPDVLRHSAASILAAQVDGVVLVVEANLTRRQALRAAAGALRACGARVLGTVLNNRTFPIPEALYRRL
jgi:Mrp family chromosome partitioning ATPase